MSDFDEGDYYAAGIISKALSSGSPTLALSDLDDWTYKISDGGFSYDERYITHERLIEAAILALINNSEVDVHTDRYGPVIIEISGEMALKQFADNRFSPYARAHQFGLDWIATAIERINASWNEEDNPLKNRSVDPTLPDLTDRASEEIVSQTEEALGAIEASNEYSAEYPVERDAVLANLKGGIVGLKEGTVTKPFVEEAILVPLRMALVRLREKGVGALVDTTIRLISRWMSGE